MKSRRRALAGTAVALGVLASAWAFSPSLFLTRAATLATDPVRLAMALCLLALLRPVLAWPTSLLSLAAGYGYGIWGWPFALVLVVITCLPPFLFARAALPPFTSSRDTGQVRAFVARFANAGERAVATTGATRTVATARLVPLPSDVISVAAGVAQVRLLPYTLGTAVGEAPWVAAGILAGASIDRLAGRNAVLALDPWLVIGTLAAAGLLLAGPVYRYYSGGAVRPGPGSPEESESESE